MITAGAAILRFPSALFMLTFEQFFGVLLAAILIRASPGADNLMVPGMDLSKRRKQGIVFGLGIALGCLSHTVPAVIGVSARIAASPAAFISSGSTRRRPASAAKSSLHRRGQRLPSARFAVIAKRQRQTLITFRFNRRRRFL